MVLIALHTSQTSVGPSSPTHSPYPYTPFDILFYSLTPFFWGGGGLRNFNFTQSTVYNHIWLKVKREVVIHTMFSCCLPLCHPVGGHLQGLVNLVYISCTFVFFLSCNFPPRTLAFNLVFFILVHCFIYRTFFGRICILSLLLVDAYMIID